MFSSNLSSSLSLSDHNVDLRSRREYESQQILRGNVVIPFLELGICLIHFFRFFFLFCFSLNNEKLKISGSPTTLWFYFESLFQSQGQFPRRYFMGQPGFPSLDFIFLFLLIFCLYIKYWIQNKKPTHRIGAVVQGPSAFTWGDTLFSGITHIWFQSCVKFPWRALVFDQMG